MVSKNQIKLITSLQQKKFRKEHQLFIAEGEKVIAECLEAKISLLNLYVTDNKTFKNIKELKELILPAEIKKISCLSTPSNCLAIFKTLPEKKIQNNGLIVVLDDIRDPGNLGAIIRLCDWFGINQIVASPQTVDVYNPKVIMASMGSIARVSINYTCLIDYLSTQKKPIFGTFINGKSIYSQKLPQDAILIFGNEANGISSEIEQLITQKISIPRFGSLQKTESLNVATATAIFLSEFKRLE